MIFYMQSIIVVVNFGKTKKKQKRKTTQNCQKYSLLLFCQICLHSFIHSTHFYWAFVPRTILGFAVVQLLGRVQLFATIWTAACQASLSITISWSLPKFMSIESVMPSNHLILCCPLLLLPSIFHQHLFQWVSSSHQAAKLLELQHQSFQWVFRVDFT